MSTSFFPSSNLCPHCCRCYNSVSRRSGSHAPHANLVIRLHDQQEVNDQTTYNREQSPAPTRRKDVSFVNLEGQERGEPLEPSPGDDAENNM